MDDTEADAMAAAMGFSSFGTQPNVKRRKFNPRADDAVVASSSSPVSLPPAGKGANAIPLGARVAGQNRDEIALGDDEDEDADPEPQYIDTSRPPAPVEGSSFVQANTDPAVQARIDAIVGSEAAPIQDHRGSGRGGFKLHGQPRDRGGKPWWDDYYDPSANVNPWEKLEKEKGLKPLSNDYLTWEESKARWEKVKPTLGQHAAST